MKMTCRVLAITICLLAISLAELLAASPKKPTAPASQNSASQKPQICTISTIMGIKLQPVIAVPSDMTMQGVDTWISDGYAVLFYQACSMRQPAEIYKQYLEIYADKAKHKEEYRLANGANERRFTLIKKIGDSQIVIAFSIDDKPDLNDFDRAGGPFAAKSVLHISVNLPMEQVKAYQAAQRSTNILSAPMPSYPIHLSERDAAVNAAQRAIQTIYDRQQAAMKERDVDGIFKNYAPDFVNIDASGKRQNLAEQRQAVRQALALIGAYLGHTAIQKITISGDTATVRANQGSLYAIADPQTKQNDHLMSETVSLDTWQKTGKTWLLTRSKVLSSKQTLNGKPFSKR